MLCVSPNRRFKTSGRNSQRILTKEKLDRHLVGQPSLTPFMSIKGGCNSKKVTFDMQDNLDDKIDKITAMINLQLRITIRINSLNLKYIKSNREDNWETIMIEIIMIREIITIHIDWIVEIGGHHTEIEVSMDKIIEEDHIM